MLDHQEARVYVVDDDARVRDALSSLLESVGFRVSCFASALDFLCSPRPEITSCVVLDLALPDLSGLELQRRLGASDGPPIVFVTGNGDVPASVKAMKAGAVEFLSKPFGEDELLRAVETALALDRASRERRSRERELHSRYARLTPREREILPFVVAGYANKQTAAELGTSEVTIGVHRGQIMRKMQARSLAELIRAADVIGVHRRELPAAERASAKG
jgi:FixJ family two-component response regulator